MTNMGRASFVLLGMSIPCTDSPCRPYRRERTCRWPVLQAPSGVTTRSQANRPCARICAQDAVRRARTGETGPMSGPAPGTPARTRCRSRTTTTSASERVDPSFDSANLSADEAWISKCVSQQGGALDGGEQSDGEVVRIFVTELTELVLGPIDDDGEEQLQRGDQGRRRASSVQS